VTGGARGIGRTIALRFVREGAAVAAGDILPNDVPGVEALALDVTDAYQVDSVIKRVRQVHGRIDILVNVAGIGLTRSFLKTTLEEWSRVLQVNLTGTFLCSQAVAAIMVAQRGGVILNIASLSGQRGGTGRAAYGASKAGVTMLTKTMAVELAPYGIRVNEIAPGPVDTPMTAVTHDLKTRQAYHNLIPMRRYASQEEIADAAVFLASDEARFITGHTLNVDGGFQAAGLMFDLED
jgi:3-oxoacyl-[acyl-carrier protein] reductase